MKNLTLIIPAKHEKDSLPVFLSEIRYLKCKKIIIIQKEDLDTLSIARKFTDVKILIQKTNGYGSAIKEGIKIAQTKYFCIINADGSMNPSYLNKMLKLLDTKKLDFVFASRYLLPGGGSDDDSLLTYFGNFFFTKLGNIFFSLNISDILFTYVMGSTKLFNLLNLKSKDFALCVEFPIKMHAQKFSYQVIPSFERKRIAGKKKVNAFKDGILILFTMFCMFFEKLIIKKK